jgi:hypothetical protein
MVVRALGAAGGQAVNDCRCRLFEIRQFQDGFRTEFAFLVGHARSLNHGAGGRASVRWRVTRYLSESSNNRAYGLPWAAAGSRPT